MHGPKGSQIMWRFPFIYFFILMKLALQYKRKLDFFLHIGALELSNGVKVRKPSPLIFAYKITIYHCDEFR